MKGLRHVEGEKAHADAEDISARGGQWAGESGYESRKGCMMVCRTRKWLLCPSATPRAAWIDPSRSLSSRRTAAVAADWLVV